MRTATLFAYGSNMDEDQMRARCPGATFLGLATLPRHALVFGGFSLRWRGAVASVVRDRARSVSGVLYALGAGDLERLDRFEGCPRYYERVERLVIDRCGRRRRVHLYVLDPILAEPDLPSPAYTFVIARAYRRFGFDRAALEAAIREAA